MLKETETEETLDFCHILVIGGISIGRGVPEPLLAMPLGSREGETSGKDFLSLGYCNLNSNQNKVMENYKV